MKELKIDLEVVKKYGTNAAVVLSVVNNSKEAVSNTSVANILGISFPTAQKTLQTLVDVGLIKACGKLCSKI